MRQAESYGSGRSGLRRLASQRRDGDLVHAAEAREVASRSSYRRGSVLLPLQQTDDDVHAEGDGGVLARCDRKRCQARGMHMFRAAEDAGDTPCQRRDPSRASWPSWSKLSARPRMRGTVCRSAASAVAVSRACWSTMTRGEAFRSRMETLAAEAGLPKRTARRGIDDAVAAGLIKRRTKAGSQGYRKGPDQRLRHSESKQPPMSYEGIRQNGHVNKTVELKGDHSWPQSHRNR